MSRVVTFGEIMLKLSSPGYSRIGQSSSFNVEYSGAEANLAVSLSKFGVDTSFVTKLPINSLGDSAIERLRSYGVNTNYISRGGDRIGIYFSEKGASQRPSRVLYDRLNSSISSADKCDFDWSSIFAEADWFHFTGITPALSINAFNICKEACVNAKRMGLTISCDLNYRSKLWSSAKANEAMSELCRYVDVCIANESDASDVFGYNSKSLDECKDNDVYDVYKHVATSLYKQFNFKIVCITLRKAYSASENDWSAIMYDGNTYFIGDKYRIHLIDRIGGGDSFCAGLIYGILKEFPKQKALDFAIASSCLKQTIEGDFNLVSLDEVFSLMNGNSSGRIQR